MPQKWTQPLVKHTPDPKPDSIWTGINNFRKSFFAAFDSDSDDDLAYEVWKYSILHITLVLSSDWMMMTLARDASIGDAHTYNNL